jgi:hypothetical protein
MLGLDFIPYSDLLFFTLHQFLYGTGAMQKSFWEHYRTVCLSKVNRLEMTGGGINVRFRILSLFCSSILLFYSRKI